MQNADQTNLGFECLLQDIKTSSQPVSKKRKVDQEEFQYVNARLEIVPTVIETFMNKSTRMIATRQAVDIMAKKNAFWPYLMDIRVVSTYDINGSLLKNHINVRCRSEFTTLLHHEVHNDVMVCFMISEQLEPLIIVVVLHKTHGKLINLDLTQLDILYTCVNNFKQKYGISGESYAYTPFEAREKLQQHSHHFHLKMRISTVMYLQCFPFLKTIAFSRTDLAQLQFELEPFTYKFSQQSTSTWLEIRALILKDIYTNILESINTPETKVCA